MSRKQLPKAITGRKDDLSKIVGMATPSGDRDNVRAAARRDAIEAEAAPLIAAPAAANDDLGAVPLRRQADKLAARRRSIAQKVIERHRTYAALGGLIPVPIANIGTLAAINMRMVERLSTLYSVPFQRERTRSIVFSVLAAAVPTGLAAATMSTLSPLIPTPAFLGLVVSSLTAGALTRAIGLVFLEGLEGADLAPAPLNDTAPAQLLIRRFEPAEKAAAGHASA
jgi:uncharacterized protein (DUF697 family)